MAKKKIMRRDKGDFLVYVGMYGSSLFLFYMKKEVGVFGGKYIPTASYTLVAEKGVPTNQEIHRFTNVYRSVCFEGEDALEKNGFVLKKDKVKSLFREVERYGQIISYFDSPTMSKNIVTATAKRAMIEYPSFRKFADAVYVA